MITQLWGVLFNERCSSYDSLSSSSSLCSSRICSPAKARLAIFQVKLFWVVFPVETYSFMLDHHDWRHPAKGNQFLLHPWKFCFWNWLSGSLYFFFLWEVIIFLQSSNWNCSFRSSCCPWTTASTPVGQEECS